MSVDIHPTAIVHPKAQIGTHVSIGAFSMVNEGVILHDNVKIHPHVIIDSGTQIGEACEIFPFAVLGQPPQHLKYAGEASVLIIGARTIIREHVTMHRGTQIGIMKTVIGDDGLFMVGSHVAHDCVIGKNVIFGNNVAAGGHVEIGDYVYMGACSAVHQFVRIGDFAMIGGKATVLGDVIPFGAVSGERGCLSGLNHIGLKRRGFDRQTIANLRSAYKALFEGQGTFEDRLAALGERDQTTTVQKLCDFIKDSNERPLCHPNHR